MIVTRVSHTKWSSDCAVGTLEFEFKEDGRNGIDSDKHGVVSSLPQPWNDGCCLKLL